MEAFTLLDQEIEKETPEYEVPDFDLEPDTFDLDVDIDETAEEIKDEIQEEPERKNKKQKGRKTAIDRELAVRIGESEVTLFDLILPKICQLISDEPTPDKYKLSASERKGFIEAFANYHVIRGEIMSPEAVLGTYIAGVSISNIAVAIIDRQKKKKYQKIATQINAQPQQPTPTQMENATTVQMPHRQRFETDKDGRYRYGERGKYMGKNGKKAADWIIEERKKQPELGNGEFNQHILSIIKAKLESGEDVQV